MNTKKADAGYAAVEMGRSKPASVKCKSLIASAFERLPLSTASGLVVAYSGGVDSHVLLVCASEWCRERRQDTRATLALRAHHIDHGLQSGSSDWAMHCKSICRHLQIDLTTSLVSVDLQSGLSPEDAARRARYDALRSDLAADEVLLTAHHADDQAETLLLQLFRGAGVDGLAAMPECAVFGEGYLARPMLCLTENSVRDFARTRQLSWIEDPSNEDNSFDRNLLRNQVMPLLKMRWPSLADSITRSASHCAEAAEVNRIFAEQRLGEQINCRNLSIPLLSAYSRVEKKVLLRSWINQHGFSMPPAATLGHLLSDLLDARSDSAGEVSWGGEACVRKYRDCIYLGSPSEFATCQPFRYHWPESEKVLTIAETGQVLTRQDIPHKHRRAEGRLVVCSRQGGERILLSGHRIHKSVKNLFQECAIPPWDRDKLPFVYCDDTLIGIVGIGFTD